MPRFKASLFLVCFAALSSLTGHCDAPIAPRSAVHARRLAFSPDGRLVVALGVPVKIPIDAPYKYNVETKGARVWTVADGKNYRDYPWVGSDAKQVAFSPDSQYIALPNGDNIKIINLATNQVRATLDTSKGQRKFYFSPDGKWFLVEGDWYKSPDAAPEGDIPTFPHYFNLDIWHLGDKDTNVTRTQQQVGPRFMKAKYAVEYPPDAAPMFKYKPMGPIAWCQNDPRGWQLARASDNGQWQAFIYKPPLNTVQIWDANRRTLKSTFPVPEELLNRYGAYMDFSPANRWFYSRPIFEWENYGWVFHFWNIAQGTMTRIKRDPEPDDIPISMQTLRPYLEGYTQPDVTPTWTMSPDENLLAFSHGVTPFTQPSTILTVYDLNTGKRLPAIFE